MGLDKVQDIRKRNKLGILVQVAIKLDVRKWKVNTKHKTAFYNDVWFRKHILKWDKTEYEIVAEVVLSKRDKTRENALLLIYEGIAYLNFISIC